MTGSTLPSRRREPQLEVRVYTLGGLSTNEMNGGVQPAGTLHVEGGIDDVGCGFDAAVVRSQGGHYGLIGMRERVAELGGELQLSSAPGQGPKCG